MAIDWNDYAPDQHREIIKAGTTHHLFSKAALAVLKQAASSEMRRPLPPHVNHQMEAWISAAISGLDGFVFSGSLREREAQMDRLLNGIAVSAVEKFKGHAQ